MKIIFLTSTPIPKHFVEMLNLKQFYKLKIAVEIWSLGRLFLDQKDINLYFKNKNLNFQNKKHIKINSLETLDKKLRENKKYIFIHLSKYNQIINDSLLVDKLNLFKIKYLAINADPRSLFYSLKDIIKFPIRFIRRKLKYKNFLPSAVITSGSEGYKDAKIFFPKSHIIDIPSIKIKWNKEKKIIQNKYICFIDENVGFSPDANLLKLTQCKNIPLYYKNLNNFFDKIEKWYNLKLIICASGKHIYKNKIKFFRNRKIIYGKTSELIQHSEFIIAHGSLAIDQAFVSKKHILTIDEKSLTDQKRDQWVYFDNFLKNKRLYCDQIIKDDIDKLLGSNLNYYKGYIKNYLKNKNTKKSFAELIFHYLNKK